MWVIKAACYLNLSNMYHAQQKFYVLSVLMQKNYNPGLKQVFLGFPF